MSGSDVTKRLLGKAVKECMREQPLSKIGIQDIVERCGLSRNSFYYNFKDKYDLVNWIFFAEFMAEWEKRELEGFWEQFLFVLQFFYSEKEFYASAFREEGQNSFSEYFQKVIKGALMELANELFPQSDDREFFAVFFVDSLMPCIKRWLLEGAKRTPEEMTRLVQSIVTGAAVKILEEPML